MNRIQADQPPKPASRRKSPPKKWRRIGLLLITIMLGSMMGVTSSIAAPLKIGIYDNPPKLFIDQSRNAKGIFPGIIQDIARKEGWEIQFIPLSFKQGLMGLETGKIDIMQDVAWSRQREEKYRFTSETVMVSWGRVYQKKGLNISTLIDLKDKRIAFMDGGIYSEGPEGLKSLMKKFELNAHFIPVNGYKQVFEYIDQGKADAGVVNRLFGKTNKAEYDIDNTPILISPISIRLAFSKSNPVSEQLARTFDHHLIEMKKDENSIYYQLIDEYLREPSKKIPAFLKPLLVVLCGLLILFAVISVIYGWQSRKKSQQILTKDQALLKSEKKFKSIFENLQDIYFDTNKKGLIHTISPSGERTFGIPKKNLLEMNIDELLPLQNQPLTQILDAQNSVTLPYPAAHPFR